MAVLIFECKDEVCLPAAYNLVSEIRNYAEKVKDFEVDESEGKDGRKRFEKIVENMMVRHPKETGELFSKLWILEDGEEPPNVFKTMTALFSSEAAIDFFTSVLPSLLQISKDILPTLTKGA